MMKQAVLFAISLYQRVSRWLPPSCRFYPSCSVYAREAISHLGLKTGLWLTAKRLCKCHPLHPGGLDPIPVTTQKGVPHACV